MMRFLARWLGEPKPTLVAKPGTSQRARDRKKIIETAREMRFEMGLEWRI